MKRKACPITAWVQKRGTERTVIQEASREFDLEAGQVAGQATDLASGQELAQLANPEASRSAAKALLVGLVPVATGAVFGRVFDLGWKAVTKRETPRPQDSSSLPALIAFTVVSSVTLAVAQRLVFRSAQKYLQK